MNMKYLKHVLSILIFFIIYYFVLDNITLYITTVFNGSITFMILCSFMLQIFLISLMVFWMRKEIPLNFKIPKWKWFYLCFFILAILLTILESWIRNIFHDFIILAPSVPHIKYPSSVYLKGPGISSILFFIDVIGIGPVMEEVIFRAYVMNAFLKNNKYHLDVLLSGLLFGVAHLIFRYRDPISFALYFVDGLFFAGIYKKYKDIRLVILLHSFCNFYGYLKPIWIFIYNYIYWNFLV